MKMAALVILIPPLAVLVGTAVAVSTAAGRAGVLNPGPHGFSEILYAFSSAGNNNGSAFAGLSANTPFYNLALAAGDARRPLLAGRPGAGDRRLAGRARRRCRPAPGTLPTHTPLFVDAGRGHGPGGRRADLRSRRWRWGRSSST